MDGAIKEVFGKNFKYTPEDFPFLSNYKCTYDSSANQYSYRGGFGGAFPFVYHGIYKIEEYKDRYVVYEKAIYVSLEYDPTTYITSEVLNLKDGSKIVINDSQKKNLKINDNYNIYSVLESHKKVISNYFEQAYEFVHTFNKEDDSFYWYSTKAIK